MRQLKSVDRGFTGIEAAIVLIAFVVVAAVFSYIILGAGFFGEKSPGTGSGEPASPIQVVGNVYGLAADPSSGINEIRFSVRLKPNVQSMNLTGMKIVFSTPATSPVTLSWGPAASTSAFTTRLDGSGDSVGSIEQNQQVEIDFLVADVPPNTRMDFDVRPPAGALSFARNTPVTINPTNIL